MYGSAKMRGKGAPKKKRTAAGNLFEINSIWYNTDSLPQNQGRTRRKSDRHEFLILACLLWIEILHSIGSEFQRIFAMISRAVPGSWLWLFTDIDVALPSRQAMF